MIDNFYSSKNMYFVFKLWLFIILKNVPEMFDFLFISWKPLRTLSLTLIFISANKIISYPFISTELQKKKENQSSSLHLCIFFLFFILLSILAPETPKSWFLVPTLAHKQSQKVWNKKQKTETPNTKTVLIPRGGL